MFGHRAIYHDGWRAVCPWPGAELHRPRRSSAASSAAPITPEILDELDRSGWELYRHDGRPDRVRRRRRRAPGQSCATWSRAGGRRPSSTRCCRSTAAMQARLATERPQTSKPRDRFVYYPGGSVVPAFAAPMVYNRPYSIEADVDIPAGGAEGVLVAQGGDAGGYTFYVKDGRLCFLYNYVGLDRFEVHGGNGGLGEGPPRAALRVRADGRAGHRQRQGRPGDAASSTSTASWSARPSSRTRRRCCSSSKGSAAATTSAPRRRRSTRRRSRSPARSARSPSTSPAS